MAKSKKSKPSKMADMPTYRPSIHLDSDSDLEPPEGDVGDDVQMTVHGKIASKSEHDHGDGPRKSMSVEIHKLTHDQGDKEGMVEDDTADGMKAAMDGALAKAKPAKKGGFKKTAKSE